MAETDIITRKRVEQTRIGLGLPHEGTDIIARCLAVSILEGAGVLSQEHIDAFVANIGAVVMAEDAYRIIDADAPPSTRDVSMAYIDELRTRLPEVNVNG